MELVPSDVRPERAEKACDAVLNKFRFLVQRLQGGLNNVEQPFQAAFEFKKSHD